MILFLLFVIFVIIPLIILIIIDIFFLDERKTNVDSILSSISLLFDSIVFGRAPLIDKIPKLNKVNIPDVYIGRIPKINICDKIF